MAFKFTLLQVKKVLTYFTITSRLNIAGLLLPDRPSVTKHNVQRNRKTVSSSITYFEGFIYYYLFNRRQKTCHKRLPKRQTKN